ncbi:MAG: type IV toxin-antitoxin system AbiEi family antitoxin domain-containing protein [Deltaproteobacteria bacterium]|nr:type IV toxin-antitoxin system AbiEi family antitoxin domain-containing protein [Deltaproteobacteria bacterium]
MSPVAIRRTEAFRREKTLFRAHGGLLRMSEAIDLGLTRRTLYTMRDAGVLEQLSRGLYRLRDLPALGNPDLVTVAKRVPQGVVCLISALAYHELTTQIPHEVHLALEKGAEAPRIEHPPVRLFWFSGPAFREGIETPKVDGLPVRIYGPEKTIADCFKFRNKIGMDVVLEALKLWRERRGRYAQALLAHARHCRVERVMRPYLEALL